MKRFYWVLLMAGLAGGHAAQAQQLPTQPPAGTVAATAPTGPWTLQRAIDYALQNNLSVRQQQLTAELQSATLRQSRAALLPSANLSGTQAWNFGTSIDPLTNEFKSQTIRSNNFSANSQVTLFSGFQLRNTVKRNLLDAEASVLDIEKSRNDLSLNVASAFLQLVLAEELVRANEIRVSSTKAQVERTQKLLKAGAIPESNLLDIQAQQASDELNVITAQNQRDLARLSLTQLLNLPSPAGFTIEVPQLADPDDAPLLEADPDGTYQTAQSLLPEIKAADLRVRSAQRSLDVARGGYYPRLGLGAGIFTGYSSARSSFIQTGLDSTFIPVINRQTGRPDPSLGLLTVQPRREFSSTAFSQQLKDNLGKNIQFSLQIPILNGLQVRTSVQRAQINIQQQALRAEQTRLTLRQSIQQSYADAIAAQRRYLSSRRQVEALTTAYRNAEIRFNNGLLNGTEFNIAKNNLTAAESTMIQAKYEFIFRRKVLDFYQGRPVAL
ncbi:TolC family protein [Hymenobacter sp. 102]|uniref:TolC family protein n=1 Tax=Hymenobacter sp. 102 TaxID=3403152 RepID=UPI003CF07617